MHRATAECAELQRVLERIAAHDRQQLEHLRSLPWTGRFADDAPREDVKTYYAHLAELIHVVWSFHSSHLDSTSSLVESFLSAGTAPEDKGGGVNQHCPFLSSALNQFLARFSKSFSTLLEPSRDPKGVAGQLRRDPDFRDLVARVDQLGRVVHRRSGVPFLLSGIAIGARICIMLAAIAHGVRTRANNNVAAYSLCNAGQVLAKSTSVSLLDLQTVLTNPSIAHRYHRVHGIIDESNNVGMCKAFIRSFVDRSAIGCPARLRPGPVASALMARYGLAGTQLSALQRITVHVDNEIGASLTEILQDCLRSRRMHAATLAIVRGDYAQCLMLPPEVPA